MNDITPEQIQARFDSLPKELQTALSSNTLAELIQRIGNEQDLKIDQIGELVDQVGLVILGFAKASNFISDISDRLEIDRTKATKLAESLNKAIFSTIGRGQVPNSSSAIPSGDQITPLEKAGDFEVIREDQAADESTNNDHQSSRDSMISDIENPPPVKMSTAKEPLVDQLLRGSTVIPEEKVVINPTSSASEAPQAPKQGGGTDPYRESIQ